MRSAKRLLTRKCSVPRLTRGRVFFCVAKRMSPKKKRPRVTRSASPTPLRDSASRAAAQLGPTSLKQCSPTPPGSPPLLGASRGDPQTIGPLPSSPKIPFGFHLPSASSSSASRNGKKGEDCPSPNGASSAAPRCVCAAQSARRSRRRSGRAFFLATFSWQDKKKYVRRSTAEPSV